MSIQFFVHEYPRVIDSFTVGIERELTAASFTFGDVILSFAVGRISGSVPRIPGELFPDRRELEFAVMERTSTKFITAEFCKECMSMPLGSEDAAYINSDGIISLMHKVQMWAARRQ